MWSDNETSEDLLGFKVHADLLIDVINDEDVLPVSIGVFGDWGSGKSSILKIIYEELKGTGDELKDETLVLYFNGWMFEGYDDAKAALLESIITEFEKNKKLAPLIGDEVKKLAKSVNWMRVLGLGFKKIALPAAAAYFTGGVSLIPYLSAAFKKMQPDEIITSLQGEDGESFLSNLLKDKPEIEQEAMAVRKFRDDFKSMIDKSKIKKLVVIIDDLDRCTYERIIDNLEAIKLFLNVENTAFVIGADPRIVRHAIAHHYKLKLEDYANDTDGKSLKLINDYLEKLIQIPYNLPKLSDHEVETYMTLLFCKKELKESYQRVLEAFYSFRQNNRYSIFGFADIQHLLNETEKSKLERSIVLIASLSSVITEGLQGNPRQIKRFLNTFILRRKLADIASIPDFKLDVLAKLMILEYTFPELFIELYTWQATGDGYASIIKEMEKLINEGNAIVSENGNAFWKSEGIKRWLRTEPFLGDIDLRDYFWIARDQLFSSISGSSLIPSHVRALFKSLVEYPSASIIKSIIQTEIIKESIQNLSHLYSLLGKELLRNPGKLELHKVYIELMALDINNAIESYKRTIEMIPDHNVIPFSLRATFNEAIKVNTKLEIVRKFFKPKSQIYNALNPKS